MRLSDLFTLVKIPKPRDSRVPRLVNPPPTIDIYGLNRIIYSTNLLPYSLEYELWKTIPTEYIRKTTRYPVLSLSPWPHLNTSVRTVSLDTFHKARTLGWVGLGALNKVAGLYYI